MIHWVISSLPKRNFRMYSESIIKILLTKNKDTKNVEALKDKAGHLNMFLNSWIILYLYQIVMIHFSASKRCQDRGKLRRCRFYPWIVSEQWQICRHINVSDPSWYGSSPALHHTYTHRARTVHNVSCCESPAHCTAGIIQGLKTTNAKSTSTPGTAFSPVTSVAYLAEVWFSCTPATLSRGIEAAPRRALSHSV